MAINRDLRISKVNPNDVEKIKRISAYDLPNNPSARGMTPDEIRGAFWRPLVETGNSLVNEIDKIAERANEYIDSVADHVGNGDVPEIPESLKKYVGSGVSGLNAAVEAALGGVVDKTGTLAGEVAKAQGYANTAKEYAEDAQGYVNDAKKNADEAKATIDQAKDIQSKVTINFVTWGEDD